MLLIQSLLQDPGVAAAAAPGTLADDSLVQIFSLSGFGSEPSPLKLQLEYSNPDVIEELNRVRVGRRVMQVTT